MSMLHYQPVKGRGREIMKAILQSPELLSCSEEVFFALRLACEEVVVNIASYAYPDDVEGFIDIDIQKTDRIILRFEDGGVPFNPLNYEEPDITLPWEERRIGGLGIYLVMKKMDAVRYEYANNRNILTIEKICE